MLVTSNTAVSAVVEYLNDHFQLICIGQLLPCHPLLEGVPRSKIQLKSHDFSFEINGKVKLALVSNLISKHKSRPVKFAHSSAGILPSNWTLDQVLNLISSAKKENVDDKLGIVLRLLRTIDSYEDLDWLGRVLKSPKYSLTFEDKEVLITEIDRHLGEIPLLQKNRLEQIILSTGVEKDN